MAYAPVTNITNIPKKHKFDSRNLRGSETKLDRYLVEPHLLVDATLAGFQGKIIRAFDEHTIKKVLEFGGEPILFNAIFGMRTLPDAWLPRLLLDLGADPSVRDFRGRTPIHQCAHVIPHLVDELGFEPQTATESYMQRKRKRAHSQDGLRKALNEVYKVVKMLVERGTSLDAVDEDGRTAVDTFLKETNKFVSDEIFSSPAFRDAFGLSTERERAQEMMSEAQRISPEGVRDWVMTHPQGSMA